MNTYQNMWIKSIGNLFFILATLILLQPAMADVVNINKADAAALQENLDGIGPVKAKAIVNYRKKHGSFKSVNDLGKVPGIGKETMLKNKNNLSTSRGLVKATDNKINSGKKKAKKSKEKAEKSKKSLKNKSDKTRKNLKADKKQTKDKATGKTKLKKKSLKSKSAKKLEEEKLKKARAKKKLKKTKKGE